MNLARDAVALVVGAFLLAAAAWLVRRVRRERRLPWWLPVTLAAAGAMAAVATTHAERAVLGWTGAHAVGAEALVAALLFSAPLEEAAKVLVLWPAVLAGRVKGPGLGVTLAVCVASGFAFAETWLFLANAELGALRTVRALSGLPAHAFAAGLWGYALGARGRGGVFAGVWLVAVLVHAFYDHVVFDRGPGLLAVTIPMLAAMALVTWSALADIAPGPVFDRSSLPFSIPEPPSLGAVRRALSRSEQPLSMRWIALGALVNVGAVICAVGLAVLISRKLGIDLALADEEDMRSNGPVALIGTAVLGAFPVAAYLVARASGAHTVLESAFAAALAIALAVVLLSIAAPPSVIFAAAAAPFAFGLACAGAWFGMDS